MKEVIKKVFNGLIESEYDGPSEWGEITIGRNILTKEISFNGKFVRVKYLISDSPITNPTEQLIKNLYGDIEIDNYPCFGSEWTGQYGVDETLTIGGHDLLNELRSHEGKYCYLEITTEFESGHNRTGGEKPKRSWWPWRTKVK